MLNRVTLVGRFVRDPELTTTKDGISKCAFTIAVDDDFKKDDAAFIQCVAWRQSADYLTTYGHKGDLVDVDGRIKTRSYIHSDGHTVYVTEVIAQTVHLLGGKKDKSYDYGSGMGEHIKTSDFPTPPADQDNDDLPF